MLYILPPPRNPSPPSPWESILYRPVNSGEVLNNASDKNKVSSDKKAKLRSARKNKVGLTGHNDMDANRNPKSLSECYFAGKGTALVLPDAEARRTFQGSENGSRQSTNIQVHLQSMFYLLRPEETLKMAVKLESNHPARTRYLVVVSRMGARGEESCLLGIDCNEKTTVGLVLKVLADTSIRLDGDGGFSVSVCGRYHIFKPVSVAAMWSALQTLHKVSQRARDQNYFLAGGLNHQWADYYERRIESDRSCLNEWHAMDQLESRRPPSPDSARTKPTAREDTERVIRTTLKEIMMSVDLDEVTSKYIRSRLEEDLDVDLGEYKSFIDQEMLTILGQMDAPTLVFDHVYLGSEWNASNFEELKKNGVGHILNVTKEIDNFFPGTFDYLNIRVYDDEKTDLLKHWDDTFKYITKAKNEGSKVLVHCKMGISRSASVVIAYAMKAYNWDFDTAWTHVKDKRTCIKPNTSFLAQLETYRGILDAMSNRDKLQRSKSETNLKGGDVTDGASRNVRASDQPAPSEAEKRERRARPRSWSPDGRAARAEASPTAFLSLEDLSQRSSSSRESVAPRTSAKALLLPRHMLMPCDNGESYSVSPNQIVHLPGQCADGAPADAARASAPKRLFQKLEEISETGGAVKDTWDPGENDPEKQGITIDNSNSNCDQSPGKPLWVSSTVVKTIPEPQYESPPETRRSVRSAQRVPDVFSSQLDCVFDREEKRQQRVTVRSEEADKRESPSRQNSWSSYDSAVAMSGAETLSRHSSWGSGDTRTLPSRNSSWGSYDTRPRSCNANAHHVNEKGEKTAHEDSARMTASAPGGNLFPYEKEDIPWLHGTVKRTKQKLEDCNNRRNEEAEPQPRCHSVAIAIATRRRDDRAQRTLSASAPEPRSLVERPALTRNKASGSEPRDIAAAPDAGLVRSLKREFEARRAAPLAERVDKSQRTDELNLKNLIGMFEQRQADAGARKPKRFSCIEIDRQDEFKRPPPVSVVRKVAATVIATAAKKQQQFGKSHPLARLTIKPRHNNPVYNTM